MNNINFSKTLKQILYKNELLLEHIEYLENCDTCDRCNIVNIIQNIIYKINNSLKYEHLSNQQMNETLILYLENIYNNCDILIYTKEEVMDDFLVTFTDTIDISDIDDEEFNNFLICDSSKTYILLPWCDKYIGVLF
jgi:hypothetical protein|tara:strand:- start:26648 stop:27058 length:411 start_codon:yes stop_codon:yes gene_type:complete